MSIFHKLYYANLFITKSFHLGEPIAGKSTLVNKILNKEILTTRVSSRNDSVICKIRNCDRIRIVTENEMGEVEEMDLTDRCDIGTKEGTLMLKKSLKEFMRGDNTRLVDVGFPTSVLKVGFCLHR